MSRIDEGYNYSRVRKLLFVVFIVLVFPLVLGPLLMSTSDIIQVDVIQRWLDSNALIMFLGRLTLYSVLAIGIGRFRIRLRVRALTVTASRLFCIFLLFDFLFVLRVSQYLG